MRILHYSLGLPPYRSGGLTKYAMDLMIAQHNIGYQVALLYPSGLSWKYPRMQIKYNTNFQGIKVYELKNPLPVPLLHGVQSPSLLFEEKGYKEKEFLKLLNLFKPNIIHLHTLMGLPRNFLLLAKKREIKLIYTSHDYYGLCLRTNFIDYTNTLCNRTDINKCSICNQNAPKNIFLRLRNEPFILKLKDLFKRSSNKIVSSNLIKEKIYSKKRTIISMKRQNEYLYLLEYYNSIFQLIDKVHFNSSVAESIYKNNVIIKNSIVIPITHMQIKDNRRKKKFSSATLYLGFIGNTTVYKGFPLLKQILLNINSHRNWNLYVWGGSTGIDPNCQNIIYKGKFNSEQLNEVYQNMDVLIVPSIWKETFSLITLEALSYGVPVIVTDNVGAKDIVERYNNLFVCHSEKELTKLLYTLLSDRTLLIDFNRSILEKEWFHSMKFHIEEIENKLYLY